MFNYHVDSVVHKIKFLKSLLLYINKYAYYSVYAALLLKLL